MELLRRRSLVDVPFYIGQEEVKKSRLVVLHHTRVGALPLGSVGTLEVVASMKNSAAFRFKAH